MSCFCSCVRVPDNGDELNSFGCGSCSCLSGFFHTLIDKYTPLFSNNQIRTHQQTDDGSSPQSQTTTSVPRILPFDDHSTHKSVNSSLKSSFNEMKPGYAHESSQDEDVCPTCLEEYTPENPRIVTKCFHHYHLSCIYEWMERSSTCPVCSKVMKFDEIV